MNIYIYKYQMIEKVKIYSAEETLVRINKWKDILKISTVDEFKKKFNIDFPDYKWGDDMEYSMEMYLKYVHNIIIVSI